MVAGESLTMTALKCNLKPLNLSAYPVTFTAAEQQELRQAFPSGVCDYARPGVGFREPIAPWLSYGDSPTSVTRAVPAAPAPDRLARPYRLVPTLAGRPRSVPGPARCHAREWRPGLPKRAPRTTQRQIREVPGVENVICGTPVLPLYPAFSLQTAVPSAVFPLT